MLKRSTLYPFAALLAASSFLTSASALTINIGQGDFFNYTSSGTGWPASVVDGGWVRLSAGSEGVDGSGSTTFFNLNGLNATDQIQVNPGPNSAGVVVDGASAIAGDKFISIQIDSSPFDGEAFTLDSISLDLKRDFGQSPTHFQLAYDADGDGFDAGDFIGSPAVNTGDDQFILNEFIATPDASLHEIRLYFWGATENWARFELNGVTAAYTIPGLEGVFDVYRDFDFGVEANLLRVQAAAPYFGGRSELRLGSPDGPAVGVLNIGHTGNFNFDLPFETILSPAVSGMHDLFLISSDSVGPGGNYFSIKELEVSREVPGLSLPIDADLDGDGIPALLEYMAGMHPDSKDRFPFDFEVSQNGILSCEIRVRADQTVTTQLLISEDLVTWETANLIYTDGSWVSDHPDFQVDAVIPLGDDLYTVQLSNQAAKQKLFLRVGAQTNEGRLNVYESVPGAEAYESPFYEIYIQKLSALNSENFAEATNWEKPFAFFTQCPEEGGENETAYFSKYIGGWSHTYTNFELDPHTPIVVKIRRFTQAEASASGFETGAPLGPIQKAVAYPKRKVDSCEVINGEVYITMSQPALLGIDIDGQMDDRDVPRAEPDGYGSSAFRNKTEATGSHSVSIFANPIIEDKPSMLDPGVLLVEQGELPPESGDWSTLYFLPGVHRFPVTESGQTREWLPSDMLQLQNNRQYYIPGDAIVFGNMGKIDDDPSVNIRVFGHGTLSGKMQAHPDDLSYDLKEIYGEDIDKMSKMALFLRNVYGCSYEGITLADPANHGAVMYDFNSKGNYTDPNYIQWYKNISWRVNNDGIAHAGNIYIEDCFLRHQDDGLYVRGLGIRRVTFWTDVNGQPLRGDFISRDRSGDYSRELPQNLIVEDCDVIYARSAFATPDKIRYGVIGTNGGGESKTYTDGTLNTGQHILFRNILVSDPRPLRKLFGYHLKSSWPDREQVGDWAGLRFENINYEHPQTFGQPNRIYGLPDARIKYWTFRNVRINGELLDQEYFDNPANFDVQYVSNMIFE